MEQDHRKVTGKHKIHYENGKHAQGHAQVISSALCNVSINIHVRWHVKARASIGCVGCVFTGVIVKL